MKKLFILLAVVYCVNGNAQLIDRNDIIISANGGLAIYHYQFKDLTNNTADPRDTTGAWTFPFQVEYGVNRWLGGALCFTYNNFLEGDSAKNEKATGIDIGLAANLHVPWNLEKFDLCATIGYGYSHFAYKVNDANGGEANAGGTVFFAGINPRFYFSSNQRLGMGFLYRYTLYNYPHGLVTDNNGNETKFSLDGPGNTFGLGLFFKI